MSRTPIRKSYYPALDSLRLFAMLAILVYHYAPHRLPGGFIGVDTFLVVSGFLLTRSLLTKKSEGFTRFYVRYLIKRVVRLALPMVMMILLSISIINIFFSELLYNVRSILLSSVLFFNNWWQIAQGSSYFQAYVHPSAFTHLWYVAVLMQLCILWPVLLALLQRFLSDKRRIALVMAGLALVSAILMAVLYRDGIDPSRVYYGTDTRLYAFAIGGVLGCLWQPAQLSQRFGTQARWIGDAMTVVGFALLVLLANHLYDQGNLTYRGGLFLAACCSAMVVAGLTVPHGILHRLLSFKPLILLGKCTYSTYLWYYPVMVMGGQNGLLSKFVWLQWLLLVVLSILTYAFVETVAVKRLLKGQLINFRTIAGEVRTDKRALGAAVLIGLLSLSCLTGLVRAKSGENQTVAEMEAQIAENERLLAEQKAMNARKALEGNATIDWLSPSKVLFCRDLKVTFIGDSILLAAAKPLSEAFPSAVIDGKVGRQLYQSIDLLKDLKKNNKIGDVVVVVLGSNGDFTEAQLDEFLKLVEDKKVFLVNTKEPRDWQDSVNAKLKAKADASKKDKLWLIDWHKLISQHPEWLYDDMTHTNQDGAQGFTTLIADSLYDKLTTKKKKAEDKAIDAKMAEEQTEAAEQASGDSTTASNDSNQASTEEAKE